MAKKTEVHYVVHCGLMLPLKNGKATCPRCHATIETEFKVTKPEKRSFRKKQAGSHRNTRDMWFDLGALLLALTVLLGYNGISNIWHNGLTAFRMDGFTLIVIMALLGYALVGGFKGKKAS